MGMRRETVAPRRLLVVEDNRRSFDELRDYFTELGHECEVALNLKTARTILQVRQMDLATVNARMAECKDAELIEEFKRWAPEMALVIYNGTRDKAVQRKLRRMGADSYLSEASDLGSVIRAVERVLVNMG